MKYFDYKENKQHGTFDFPLEYYSVTTDNPRYDMPYHWHTECEIIRVLEGEFLIVTDGNKILAKQGDIIFIHGGVLHGGTPTNCIYECIVFDMKLLLKQNNACSKKIYDIINHSKLIETKFPNNIEELNNSCHYLFESMKSKDTGYEFITQGSLYHILGIILKHKLYATNKTNTKKTEKMISQFKKALSLIENNYSNTITLEDLSKASGMTPKYFCKFFYEMSNKTPIEYLNLYRIETACEQILATDLPVTEIALNCGFNDVSYFIKTFKKHKGVTPRQYLKNSIHTQ